MPNTPLLYDLMEAFPWAFGIAFALFMYSQLRRS